MAPISVRHGIVLLVLLAGTGRLAAAAERMGLRDGWSLQSSAHVVEGGAAISTADYAASEWHATTVPTTVLAALVRSGVYPDPYFGENLKRVPGYRDGRWLALRADSPFYPSWWFRTVFRVPDEYRGKRVRLHLDGVNYRANVWLNGRPVATDDEVVGMFRRFEFDVTGLVRHDAFNALAVEVIAPGHLPDREYETKQLEATTGWDDHNPQPPDLNMGLWQDVYLTAHGPVRLRHPYVEVDLQVPSLEQADLAIRAEVTNADDAPRTVTLLAELRGVAEPLSLPLELAPGETRGVELDSTAFPQLLLRHPRVWWPHPLGPQELYELDLRVLADGQVSDHDRVRFGVCEVTSHIDEDGWRVFTANGRRVLIRGGAWMTSDMLLRLEPRRYKALVRYAREAHLNMLRSEGFSIRETDTFYDLCDELGVMVTQQIFGRNIPDESLAVACTEDTILRIRNHPSLVHFIGHDETYPTEALDRAYRELIARHRPGTSYQTNSGDENETRFESGGTRTGWRQVWTYTDPGFYYKDIVPGHEYHAWGFAQSGGIGGVVAPYESARRMVPESEQWPLWSDALSFHTVTQGGPFFELAVQQLERRYGAPTGLEDFCRKAMLLNYESARGMFEAWGREKYRATGITTWKYNAAWPAFMTWQYIDWYLIAGGAYYGAKKACEPLHAQYSYDDRSVWVLNSLREPREGLEVAARVYNLDMTEKLARDARVRVEADGKTKAFTLEWPDGLGEAFILKLTLSDGQGRRLSDNLYWLSTKPEVLGRVDEGWDTFRMAMLSTADFTSLRGLPHVRLTTHSRLKRVEDEYRAAVTVSNPSEHLAFAIHLAIKDGPEGQEVAPTYWDDNYFSLLPGEEKTVEARFALCDLSAPRPAIMVDGWNIQKDVSLP